MVYDIENCLLYSYPDSSIYIKCEEFVWCNRNTAHRKYGDFMQGSVCTKSFNIQPYSTIYIFT